MDSDNARLLANPTHPSHIVYPYTDDRRLVEAVGFYTSCGLAGNGAVILIATEPHRYAIKKYLSGDGNVEIFQRTDRLVLLDAAEVLSGFMVDGNPDPQLFRAGINTLIERVRHNELTGRNREVRLFGEMVDFLWPTNSTAAERLEELGNEVIEEYSIPIL